MRMAAIAVLCGTSCLLFLPKLPALSFLISLLLMLLSLYQYSHAIILRFLLIASCAFIFSVWQAEHRLAWQLPKKLEGRILSVQGTIVSLPEGDRVHTHFIFSLKKLMEKKVPDIKIKLNWYGKYPVLKVGDHWQFIVKLKRIHGFINPAGFDYARAMLQKNIRAIGYVKSSALNHLLSSPWYSKPIDRWRQYLGNIIARTLKNSPYRMMIAALIIGEKDGLQAAQWQVLQRTGTNHLLVIAGLHIGIVSSLTFFLFNYLWRQIPYLLLLFPAKQIAAFASLLSAFFYSALAGFSIPTQRALVMMMIFMLSIMNRRYLPLGLGIAYALLSVLILHPLATLNLGFWLSFAAVSIIFYSMGVRLQLKGIWHKWGRLQLALSVGLLPFTLLFFQNASLIAPLANLIVIPIVGFLVVPLSLLAILVHFLSITFSHWLLHLAVLFLSFAWHILVWLAEKPLLSWQQAIYSFWSLVAAYIGILLLLAPRGFSVRYLGIFWCLPLLFLKPQNLPLKTIKFTLLDVGQGLASVVQTAHHVLIFDTETKFSNNFDLGSAVVVPFLRQQGIRKVNVLVISHDNNHIGDAHAILNTMSVHKIFTSVPERFRRQRVYLCLAGQHWQWDGVSFRFLYPDKSHLHLDNNSSCVLRVSVGKQHLLLTGDIEQPVERFLVAHKAQFLPAQVLVAPHHGSKTSSSLLFLRQVRPRYVLYSVGYLNRFHFPSTSVVSRYQSIGAEAFSTVKSGAITVIIQENKPIKPSGYVEKAPRFWRHSV